MGLFTINIEAKVNLPPSAIGNNTIIVDHNITYTFTQADFTTDTVPQYSDPDGDPVKHIQVLTLPSFGAGSLEYNSVTVTVDQEIPMSGIILGLLKFIPDSTLSAYNDGFNFDASDTGSELYSGLTGTISFNVKSYVNLPPITGDNTVSVAHFSTKVFATADFTTGTTPAYSDPEGDAALNLRVNTLPIDGTLRLSGTRVVVNQVIPFTSINSGLFTYTAARDITTLRTVSFDFDIEDAGSGQFSS